MADGVGIAPTQPGGLTRFSGPGHYCSANHPQWSGWQELHLRPPRSERGRLRLTLHPENGCQGWTRTNTVRFNKPSCYFDTTWQFEIGAAGKTRTCIGSFRRRMPLYLGHGSIGKWSARQDLHLRSLGPKPSALAATLRAGKWRIRRGSHPQPSRRQRVAPLIELRIRNGGRCW